MIEGERGAWEAPEVAKFFGESARVGGMEEEREERGSGTESASEDTEQMLVEPGGGGGRLFWGRGNLQ